LAERGKRQSEENRFTGCGMAVGTGGCFLRQ